MIIHTCRSRTFSRIRPLHFLSTKILPYRGNKVLGVVRENINMWERRSPLSPDHVRKLVDQGFKVVVQPCSRRIFSDTEYKLSGAEISENIDEANLIIGVKQISSSQIKEGKSYMFFSHVIKAQPANMLLLDTVVSKKARLFDYECITEDGRDDKPRLVAFGKYAGIAGMFDGLQGLGQRLLADGFSTPFLNIPMTYMNDSLSSIHNILSRINKQIQTNSVFQKDYFPPLVFAFTGTGNVSIGAREIFEQLPHEYISVKELPNLQQDILTNKRKRNILYGVVVKVQDYIRLKTISATSQVNYFEKKHYYTFPDQYISDFHTKVAPYITVLVNGLYWEDRFPRLLTKLQIRELRKVYGVKNGLKLVIDISCDVQGSVEFLSHSTVIERPFYTYIPEDDVDVESVDAKGILMLGVDVLPTEIPRDASHHFSSCLIDLIPPLLLSKGSTNSSDMNDLPPELRRACIASHGELTAKWSYIDRLRAMQPPAVPRNDQPSSSSGSNTKLSQRTPKSTQKNQQVAEIELRGHLFDSGLFVIILDYLESIVQKTHLDTTTSAKLEFNITSVDIKPNTSSGPVPSRVHLQISGECKLVSQTTKVVTEMVSTYPHADATATLLAFKAPKSKEQMKRILLFGSGRVAKPVLKLFEKYDDTFITVATMERAQADELINCLAANNRERAQFVRFQFPQDNHTLLPILFQDCDIAISLLPATMHIPLAEESIRQKKHFITASYTSPAMAKLDEAAKSAGVILMNEAGLDPGIDHMLIMKAVDELHSKGGIVEEVVSLCGGLPDPVAAANNPFMYKISWSPKGALLATQNSALYLKDGKEIAIAGDQLLANATSSNRFPTLRLEVIPNRNSISYKDLYGVPRVHTICRGTLRYEGWADIMLAVSALTMLSTEDLSHLPSTYGPISTWSDYITYRYLSAYGKTSRAPVITMIKSILSRDNRVKDIDRAVTALEWLGIFADESSPSYERDLCKLTAPNALDSLCSVLELRLPYSPGERDMVAMFHTVIGRLPDGSVERHTSRLLDFGSNDTVFGDTAMSRTVGFTVAAAAELVLNGQVPLRGVLIPTHSCIYEPLLARLKDLGLTWTDSVEKFDFITENTSS